VGKLQLALIHAVISGLLWFYSTGYKKQFLIGNIIVSLLTAMTLVIVLVYERNLFQPQEAAGMQAARTIFIITFFYFLFAFLISMYRELVKDMEDREGDAQFDCRTIAVVWGNQRTKLAALFFALCIFAGVIYIQLLQVKGGDFLSAFNLFIMAQVPLLISSHMLWRAKSQQQFAVVSQVIKLSMLLGILTMVYFYYLLV
jgi:4-hydroxybenzoate polyprenyltransferase